MAHIRLRRTITADNGAVFHALTVQEHISQWFAPYVITTPVSGTYAAFAFDEDIQFKVFLKEIIPGEKIVWEYTTGDMEWDHSVISFHLKKAGEKKTLLSFSHKGLPHTDKMEKWTNSWRNFLDRLKEYSEKTTAYA